MNYKRLIESELTKRLCLGTVQFGLDYGIANEGRKVEKGEVFEILKYAYNKGINNLDTAFSYGESENLIGEFINKSKLNFKVISKLPTVSKPDNEEGIKKIFYQSLTNLNRKDLYGYLIHKFDNFLKYDILWDILEDLKKRGYIKKIGFSLYSPRELEVLLDKRINFDIIQLPYSIFDRRFEKYFKLLRENNIEIYARSVFLHGLVFLKPDDLSKSLSGASKCIYKVNDLARKNDISINALCLNFALLNANVDKVIIGIDSLEHLKENIEDINLIQKVRDICDKLDSLNIEDEKILLPYDKFIYQSEQCI